MWTELLEALEALIAKKRAIKQAVTQQLLSGKTRLPGFSGERTTKPLVELGSVYGGLTGKTKSDFGAGAGRYVTFVNVMANVVIDCDSFEPVSISPAESQNPVAKGDLLFNSSSETPEELREVCAMITPEEVPHLFLNRFCFGFRLGGHAPADGLFPVRITSEANEGRDLAHEGRSLKDRHATTSQRQHS